MSESLGQSHRPSRRIALLTPAITFDERVAHALQLFDSVLWAFTGTTRTPWTLTSPEAAQVLVVHEDDDDERIGLWREEGRLVVAIATEPQREHVAPISLVYPFRAKEVLNLLERLDVQLEHAPLAPVPEAPGREHTDDWSMVEALATFREVENDKAWLVARDARMPILWVRGDAGAYVADPLAVQAIRDGSLQLNRLLLRKSAEPGPELPRRSGLELAWFAGYHASERLAPQLQSHMLYRIVRWPNFGLIRPQSAQLRLAATLSAHPSSLEQLIQSGTLPQELTVRTLNAFHACGLLVKAQPGDHTPGASALPRPSGAPDAQSPRREGLFASMRRHLGLPVDRS